MSILKVEESMYTIQKKPSSLTSLDIFDKTKITNVEMCSNVVSPFTALITFVSAPNKFLVQLIIQIVLNQVTENNPPTLYTSFIGPVL